MSTLNRITFVPGLMDGRATIRGLRFTVNNVMNYLRDYDSLEGLLVAFPFLEREDIEQALEYAHKPRHRRRCAKHKEFTTSSIRPMALTSCTTSKRPHCI